MSMMTAPVVLAAILAVPAALPQQPAKPAAAEAEALKLPDTPAGRALQEFVESFNAGGDKRKAWVEGRTTMQKDVVAGILQQDAEFLEEFGAMSIVRLPQASPTTIAAIVRHEKNGAHGHLTLEVDAAAPHKVTNMQLRPATPEEIKGL